MTALRKVTSQATLRDISVHPKKRWDLDLVATTHIRTRLGVI